MRRVLLPPRSIWGNSRRFISSATLQSIDAARLKETGCDFAGAQTLLEKALEQARNGGSTRDEDLRVLHNRAGLLALKRRDGDRKKDPLNKSNAVHHLGQALDLALAMAAQGRCHDSFIDVGGLQNDLAVAHFCEGDLAAADGLLRRARFSAERAYKPSKHLLAATCANQAILGALTVEVDAWKSSSSPHMGDAYAKATEAAIELARLALRYSDAACWEDRPMPGPSTTEVGPRALRAEILIACGGVIGMHAAADAAGPEEGMVYVVEGLQCARAAGEHHLTARALAFAAALHLNTWQRSGHWVSCNHLAAEIDDQKNIEGSGSRWPVRCHTEADLAGLLRRAKHILAAECLSKSDCGIWLSAADAIFNSPFANAAQALQSISEVNVEGRCVDEAGKAASDAVSDAASKLIYERGPVLLNIRRNLDTLNSWRPNDVSESNYPTVDRLLSLTSKPDLTWSVGGLGGVTGVGLLDTDMARRQWTTDNQTKGARH